MFLELILINAIYIIILVFIINTIDNNTIINKLYV